MSQEKTERFSYLVTLDNSFWIEIDVPVGEIIDKKTLEKQLNLMAAEKFRSFLKDSPDADLKFCYHDIDEGPDN